MFSLQNSPEFFPSKFSHTVRWHLNPHLLKSTVLFIIIIIIPSFSPTYIRPALSCRSCCCGAAEWASPRCDCQCPWRPRRPSSRRGRSSVADHQDRSTDHRCTAAGGRCAAAAAAVGVPGDRGRSWRWKRRRDRAQKRARQGRWRSLARGQ